jgi:lysozyme family protein
VDPRGGEEVNTRAVNSAAGVIHAALKQCQTPAGIALALESAGLLMSPEAAKDIASVSTDAVGVAERAVAELKREHDESARLRAERNAFCNRVDTLTAVAKGNKRHVAELFAELQKTQRERDTAHDELTGSNLSLYEEEQETARLRLALASAQRGRRDLRARVAELETERHTTNDALADVTVALRAEDGTGGTLPAWLYQRFVPVAGAEGWDALPDEDRSYWHHTARAVERAVKRGGFKQPGSAP